MKHSKNIFLVEDDPDDQLFFSEAIEEIENAELISIATNGIEALHKLESATTLPDYIFMDINMPLMNGMDCLAEIVKKPHLKVIPVIILSTARGNARLAQQMGACAYLQKPTNIKVFRSLLERIFNLNFINQQHASSAFLNL